MISKKESCHFVNACLGALGLFALVCITASQAGYRINWTPSLPPGIWKVDALTGPVQRGQIVSVCPPNTPVFQTALTRHYLSWGLYPGGLGSLLKPVAAIAGDEVTITTEGIAVNGTPLPNSKAPTQDSMGRPLEPVKTGTYTVQPGTVWLASNYAHSFDSRYFGPMPTKNILGIAKPIWVRGPIQE